MKKFKTEKFIEKARKVHNNKYDYSKVDYKHSYIKVIIICPIHGEFEQKPYIHSQGFGCPKCGNEKISKIHKSNTEQFIQKARAIHGNKYDYSKVVYINIDTKIIIICLEHGEFIQNPGHHLQGQGCLNCGFINTGYKLRLSKIEFITKAQQVHNNKYDYSKVNYINSQTKVTIICPEHGEFLQKPNSHLNGNGCYYCGNEKISKSLKSNKEEFIQKAKEVHGNKYDYSKVVYINNRVKVIIICKDHGEFEQIPNSHLLGNGCPKCNSSKGELALEAIFKKHNIEYKSQYNIPEIVANYEIDFYLPDYRLLIEFHGKQHYEYIPFFHDGDYTFEDQKTRDDMVRDAAKRWEYRYLEFNYRQLKHMSTDQFEEMVINKINNKIP